MRIRRNASKLLGSTTLYAIPPPPAPAAACCSASASASASADDREMVSSNVCELNCSPWDLMLLNLDDYFLTNRSEEEGEEGNSGNSIVTEQQEEQKPISTPVITRSCASAELTATKAADQLISGRDPIRKERMKKKKACKGKEKDTTAADDDGSVPYCKKSDGKRWRCKRAAQLPHSFCSYHIAQVKSYSCGGASNHPAPSASRSEAAGEMRLGGGGYGPDSSGLYYYYEGFGPRRGKRRGDVAAVANSACSGDAEMVKEEEIDNHDENSCEIKMDLGRFDVEEGGDVDDKNNDNCGMERDVEVKKRPAAVIKKRGRKPFKCRSLKSLL